MKTLEELGVNDIKIFQDDQLYRFTSDAILLSRFVKVTAKDTVADFCSGSGIVGLHLYALNPFLKSVALFEMQEELYSLSLESIKVNGLEKIFSAYNVRVQDLSREHFSRYSLIVCNPPYMRENDGGKEKNSCIAMCKREITINLSEIFDMAKKCLKFGGRICMVNKAERLADVIFEMRKNKIEPKKLQFIRGANKEPYLFLIEGVKGGKQGLKVLKEAEN